MWKCNICKKPKVEKGDGWFEISCPHYGWFERTKEPLNITTWSLGSDSKPKPKS